MSKWEKVMDNRIGGAGSKAERVKQDRIFNKMMSFNKESDIAALKKEGDTMYLLKQTREDNLVAAFEEKKLKSKALIKEAKKVVLEREKKAKKTKEAPAADVG
jgi:hypothetical protein